VWRATILVLAAVFFLGPLVAAAKFSLQQDDGGTRLGNYTALLHDGALGSALATSLEIAALTVAIVLALMVPTVVLVRLRAPRLGLVLETVSVLPIVIPPVVMAAGLAALQGKASGGLAASLFGSPITALTPFYVILALPFTYRALDVGLAAIDLRTLVDAARSLGASAPSALVRVVLPNIRSAILGSAFLAIALVLGEVVISSILLYVTFPVQVVQTGQDLPGESVALSLASLLLTWALLFAIATLAVRDARPARPRARLAPRSAVDGTALG
jgi:putative spermidine/putrescine transport system permease protein